MPKLMTMPYYVKSLKGVKMPEMTAKMYAWAIQTETHLKFKFCLAVYSGICSGGTSEIHMTRVGA